MPEIFEIDKDRDGFFRWFIIEASTGMPDGELARACALSDGGKHTVMLTFNGVEMSVRTVVKRMQKAYYDEVRKAAEAIVEDSINDFVGTLEDVKGILLDRLKAR